ncbi:MAG TPA: SMP-30/gluconolactonase/LRE family protein [Bacilli bacterium]
MTEGLNVVVDIRARIGEGPCWDAENELLYWVDIMENQIHIHDAKTNENRTIQADQHVGAVVLRQLGGVALAMEHGFYTMDLQTEQFTFIGDPEADLPGNRFNDGKCDAAGRFWAGTMNYNGVGHTGFLYCLEPNHTIRKVVDGVAISNGLTWSVDHKIMYYIDSVTKQVAAYDYDLSTGGISNRKIVITIPENGGLPDGMTLDAEGMIWIAQWGGYQVSRWNPHTGQQIDSIQLPVSQVSSCTFGGEHMDVLYITTATNGLDSQALLAEPLAGSLFSIKTKVKGVPSYKFGG